MISALILVFSFLSIIMDIRCCGSVGIRLTLMGHTPKNTLQKSSGPWFDINNRSQGHKSFWNKNITHKDGVELKRK